MVLLVVAALLAACAGELAGPAPVGALDGRVLELRHISGRSLPDSFEIRPCGTNGCYVDTTVVVRQTLRIARGRVTQIEVQQYLLHLPPDTQRFEFAYRVHADGRVDRWFPPGVLLGDRGDWFPWATLRGDSLAEPWYDGVELVDGELVPDTAIFAPAPER